MGKEDKIFLAYSGQMGEETEKKTKERVQWILDMVGNGKDVLDIGCSQGIISILVAEQGNKVTGLDVNAENIEFAKTLLQENYASVANDVRFEYADFYKWKSEKSYDVILLTEVLEHLQDASLFLSKASEVLSENGKLIITVPFGVLNHPDHYSTFYLKNLYDLVNQYFDVGKIDFVGKCLAVIAYTKDSLEKKILLDENILQKEEEKFFEVDKYQSDRIEELYTKLCDASEKYKGALKNYETAKEWHKNALDKNAHLEQKIAENKIEYGKIENRLSVKEEEFRLEAEKCKQQSELITEFKTLGSQREVLISEYIAWNEQNKDKIAELEKSLSSAQNQCESLKQEVETEKKEKNSCLVTIEGLKQEVETEKKEKDSCLITIEDLRNTIAEEKAELESKAAKILHLQKRVEDENFHKEKCIAELQVCLTELEEKKQLLEELKKCEDDKAELKTRLENEIDELQSKSEQEIAGLQMKLEEECANQEKAKIALYDAVTELQEQEAFLSELRQYIRKLETQNKYLASENAECRRKLSIITDTKLGQFALKMYHLLKRIYRKLFRRK